MIARNSHTIQARRSGSCQARLWWTVLSLLMWSVGFVETSSAQTTATDHFNKGIEWLNEGETDKAIPEFSKAIELDPKMADAYYQRGTKTIDVGGDMAAAMKDLDKAIELDPKHSDAFLARGGVWEARKEWDKAITEYTKYILLNRHEPNGYSPGFIGRGTCRIEKKDYAGAIEDLTKAVINFPNSSFAYKQRAIAYERAGEKEKAEADRKTYEKLSAR